MVRLTPRISSNQAGAGVTAGDAAVRPRHSPRLLEDARQLFQERSGRRLSKEDARQSLENLAGFFAALKEHREIGTSRDPNESQIDH
jgi:hypothetical protein